MDNITPEELENGRLAPRLGETKEKKSESRRNSSPRKKSFKEDEEL